MKKKYFLGAALAAALILAAEPSQAAVGTPPSPVLKAIIADYDAFDRQTDPLSAGGDGDQGALSRLPDDSPAGLERDRQALTQFKQRLTTLASASLNDEDALNRTFLLGVIDDALQGLKLDVARLNFDAYGGFHLMAAEMAQGTQIRDRADADAYLTRLSLLPAYYDTEIADARRGVATGFTQPKPTTEVVIAIVEKQVARAPTEDPLLAPSPPSQRRFRRRTRRC